MQLFLRKNVNAVSKAVKTVRLMSLSQNEQNPEQKKSFTERLGVTLCGRIYKNPTKLANGSMVIPLLTRNIQDEFKAKHDVLAPPSIVNDVSVDRLNEGNRVYVTGVIRYSDFLSADGRPKQQGQIIPSNIIPCEQNEDPASDINEVNLFGSVKSKPEITENATFFKVTVAIPWKERKDQNNKGMVHNVIVRGNDSMRQQANLLEDGSIVFILGILHTQFVRNERGNMQGTYLIRPRQLIIRQ